MPDSNFSSAPAEYGPRLAELQRVIDGEIPMCQQMGVRVEQLTADSLIMSCPLELNRNHQATAFAGSLNALCTITGWGATYLETLPLDPKAVIVIRRSSIKYHRPVNSEMITARCRLANSQQRAYFAEMLAEKGQAKLDLTVEIDHPEHADRPRVVFCGSYVVASAE